MKVDIDMKSDDFEQLEANIIAKYAGIRQKATEKMKCQRLFRP